jgi:uncharacterized protein YjbI with pentapeptide repeats
MKLLLIASVLLSVIFVSSAFASTPDWVKNTAGWWATDAISETEFVNAMEYLVNEGIIRITTSTTAEKSENIPDWVKNTAGWWATDAISETEFVNAMEYLVNEGIINTKTSNDCQKDLEKISKDVKRIKIACSEFNSSKITELIPYDTSHKYNKKGFTGEDFPVKKSESEFRIFVLGGSVMQGAGNSSIETSIPHILQKMIDKNDENNSIRVINASGSAGDSIYQAELINTVLTQFEPDLVMVLTGWNDLSSDHPVKMIKHKWNDVCQNSEKNDFGVMIFLQPIAGFGDKNLTKQEKINSLTGENHNKYQLIQQQSTYDYLTREMMTLEKNCVVIDSRDMFDEIKGSVYWDQGHISEVGNFLVADRFLKEMNHNYSEIISYNEELYTVASKYNHPSTNQLLLSELGIKVDSSETPLKDEKEIEDGKGDYFKLKQEFGLNGILVGEDLRDVDLSKIILDEQNLTGANLSGHDLRDFDLSNTVIRGANLSNTNLEEKNLSGMDLRGINFSNANLRNVNFTDAIFSKTIQVVGNCNDENPILNLIKNFKCISVVIKNEEIRTDFTNADLTNTKFGIKENEKNQMMYFVDFTNADLTGSNLDGVQIFGGDFTGSKLNGISGKQIFILESNFNNTNMNDFDIRETWIQSTSFKNVQMTNGIFDSITFIDTHFLGTDLEGTNIMNLNEVGDNTYDCKNNSICRR